MVVAILIVLFLVPFQTKDPRRLATSNDKSQEGTESRTVVGFHSYSCPHSRAFRYCIQYQGYSVSPGNTRGVLPDHTQSGSGYSSGRVPCHVFIC